MCPAPVFRYTPRRPTAFIPGNSDIDTPDRLASTGMRQPGAGLDCERLHTRLTQQKNRAAVTHFDNHPTDSCTQRRPAAQSRHDGPTISVRTKGVTRRHPPRLRRMGGQRQTPIGMRRRYLSPRCRSVAVSPSSRQHHGSEAPDVKTTLTSCARALSNAAALDMA